MARSRAVPVLLVALFVLTVALQVREIRRVGARGELLPAGSPAPSSEAVPVESHRGKTVIVSFWASWCGPCRAEMPEVAGLVADYDGGRKDGDPELVWLAVNAQEDPEQEAVKAVVQDPRYARATFLWDRAGDAGRAWHVEAYPTTYVVDAQGRVAGATEGYDAFTRARLARLVHRREEERR